MRIRVSIPCVDWYTSPQKNKLYLYIYIILYTIRIITISSFLWIEIYPLFKKRHISNVSPSGVQKMGVWFHSPRPRHGDFWPCTGGFPWPGFYGELFLKPDMSWIVGFWMFFFFFWGEQHKNYIYIYIHTYVYIYIYPEIFLGTSWLTNIFSFFFDDGVDFFQRSWPSARLAHSARLAGVLMGEVYLGPKFCPFCPLKK